MESLNGTLEFTDNNTRPVVVFCEKEYTIWNNFSVTMHTSGYPQINATINALHTCFKGGEKCEFFILSNNQAYITNFEKLKTIKYIKNEKKN